MTEQLLAEIECLKKENEELKFKLAGVMHFVDKWLDDNELSLDEVQRADLAREKALVAIEEAYSEMMKEEK